MELNTPIQLNARIPGTDWYLMTLTLTSLTLMNSSRGREGSIVIMDRNSGHREPHRWTAQYVADGIWKITGDGALTKSGTRIPAAESYPFSLNDQINRGVKAILAKWLNDNAKSNNVAAVKVEPPKAVPPPHVITLPVTAPAVTKPVITLPVAKPVIVPPVVITPKPETVKLQLNPKPLKEESMKRQISNPQLIDRVKEACLKHFGITEAQFAGDHAGLVARHVFCYITKDLLEQGGGNGVLSAFGGKSQGAVYTNADRGKERLEDDAELAAWAKTLVAEAKAKFKLDGASSGDKKPAPTSSRKPVVAPRKKKVKRPATKCVAVAKTAVGKGHKKPIVTPDVVDLIQTQLPDYLIYGYLTDSGCTADELCQSFHVDVDEVEKIIGRVHIKVMGDSTGSVTETIKKLVSIAQQFSRQFPS